MTRPVADIDIDCERRGPVAKCELRYADGTHLLTAGALTHRGAMKAAERGVRLVLLTYRALAAKRDYEDRLAEQ